MNISKEKCALAQIDWWALAHLAKYRAGGFAELLHISLRRLERCFSKIDGLSPQAWLEHLRMDEAARLLEKGNFVSEIVFELGFKDHAHFYRRFKHRYGRTPQEWFEARVRTGERSAAIADEHSLSPQTLHALTVYYVRAHRSGK